MKVATTDESLLRRVRDQADRSAWQQFFGLYHPLLRRYARLRGLSTHDAEDVAQECMRILTKRMTTFEYSRSPGRRFRAYLHKLANDVIVDSFRRRRPRQAKTGELAALEERATAEPDLWQDNWVREHLRYCLRQAEEDFAPQTIQAFRLYVLEEKPVTEVCSRLQLTADQVYQAKVRVTRRLQADLRELVGDSW